MPEWLWWVIGPLGLFLAILYGLALAATATKGNIYCPSCGSQEWDVSRVMHGKENYLFYTCDICNCCWKKPLK